MCCSAEEDTALLCVCEQLKVSAEPNYNKGPVHINVEIKSCILNLPHHLEIKCDKIILTN